MKVGLFGGSFNPIHKGHMALADNFVRELRLDKLILMPANIPPHKAADNLISGKDRLNMCKIAAEKIENTVASDFELNRNNVSYTVDTLEELYKKYGVIYLIMGTDMFLSLQNWHKATRIFQLSVPCVSSRNENEYDELKRHSEYLKNTYGAESVVKAFPVIKLSSTEIRKRLAENEACSDLVDGDVLKYIKENMLFRGKNND